MKSYNKIDCAFRKSLFLHFSKVGKNGLSRGPGSRLITPDEPASVPYTFFITRKARAPGAPNCRIALRAENELAWRLELVNRYLGRVQALIFDSGCRKMCLCLGPMKSGKTLLLRNLQGDSIDEATSTVQSNGINLFQVRNSDGHFEILIREIGGSMAPIWKHHLDRVYKLIYVVDTSNLCQISAAGVLLYSLLVEPKLERAKFALILTKMDLSYRQMRNEALLMLHFSRLQREVKQEITVIEASGVTGQGVDKLREWIFDPATIARSSRR